MRGCWRLLGAAQGRQPWVSGLGTRGAGCNPRLRCRCGDPISYRGCGRAPGGAVALANASQTSCIAGRRARAVWRVLGGSLGMCMVFGACESGQGGGAGRPCACLLARVPGGGASNAADARSGARRGPRASPAPESGSVIQCKVFARQRSCGGGLSDERTPPATCDRPLHRASALAIIAVSGIALRLGSRGAAIKSGRRGWGCSAGRPAAPPCQAAGAVAAASGLT